MERSGKTPGVKDLKSEYDYTLEVLQLEEENWAFAEDFNEYKKDQECTLTHMLRCRGKGCTEAFVIFKTSSNETCSLDDIFTCGQCGSQFKLDEIGAKLLNVPKEFHLVMLKRLYYKQNQNHEEKDINIR